MSCVFRCDHYPPDNITGSFSLLLFDTDDPNEWATRVFNTGLVSACGPLWQLKDMTSHLHLCHTLRQAPVWREVTDDPEVQAALKALDEQSLVS